MKIIKNSAELASLVDSNEDLFLKDHDVRIEYQVAKGELRDVYCRDLILMNDEQKFDFNGGNFNGWNFNGGNFNGQNFNGRDFNGRKVSYYAFFNCYGSMTCESYKGRRTPHAEPVCLDGKIIITEPAKDTVTEEAIALLTSKGFRIVKD